MNPSLYFASKVCKSVLILSLFKTSELVDEALREWLPSQEVFDRFAGEKNVSERERR